MVQTAVAQITVHADGLDAAAQERIAAAAAGATDEAARLWSIDPGTVRGDLTVHPTPEGYESFCVGGVSPTGSKSLARL